MTDINREIVMSGNASNAINWLKEYAKQNESLGYAWQILREYYDKCKDELNNIDINISPFESQKEQESICANLQNTINDPEFVDECCDFFNITKENFLGQLKSLTQNKGSSNLGEQWFLAKTMRLYNMHLKLGHSARITYIAHNNFQNATKNITEESENIKLLEKSLLLSATLHDIGRFYQSMHYNDLNDERMSEKEKKKLEISDEEITRFDHAVAGYYFSIASALDFRKKNNLSTDEEITDFIAQTIAATVIRYHGLPNSTIPHFDFAQNIDILIPDNHLKDKTLYFINHSYDESKAMKYKIADEIDEQEKRFIDAFFKHLAHDNPAEGFYISESTLKLKESIQEPVKQMLQNLLNKIKEGTFTSRDEDTFAKQLTETINNIANNNSTTAKDSQNIHNAIKETLKEFLDYDIAKAINSNFREDTLDDNIRFIFSSAMATVMDADKIDILNQRAKGIYNTPYRINKLEVIAPPNKSFTNILNNYFKYNIDLEHFIMDKSIINIVNSLDSEAKETLKQKLELNGINIFTNDQINEDIQRIEISKGKTIITGKQDHSVEIDSNIMHSIFCEASWINFITNGQENFETLRKTKANMLNISIDRDDFNHNISQLPEEEQLKAFKQVLISDGLTERFKKEGDNPPGRKWVFKCSDEDSEHLDANYATGMIWQLNQLVLTNMRSKQSYQFILDNHILDDILLQFHQQDPMLAKVLTEYVDYTKGFMNHVIENTPSDLLTDEVLTQARLDYANKKQEAKESIADKPIINTNQTNTNENLSHK